MANGYASLGTTDATDVSGARIVQHLERLDVELAGTRVTVSRDSAGAARIRVVGTGTVELVVAPEVAVRVGSHLAALGAESLGERGERAA